MLFNSYDFILLFLPAVLAGFYYLGSQGWHEGAIGWLALASLLFYGWWNPWYLLLIVASIVFNFLFGFVLSRPDRIFRKSILVCGIAGNLGVLGYFKYAVFIVGNINWMTTSNFSIGYIVLPLAISFFTFQQITYLVDSYKGIAKEYNFLHYTLFVSFFPQLIAGPIVHHTEMLPQFLRRTILKFKSENLAIGFTIFTLGLFKKVIIADSLSEFATPVFGAASLGIELTLFEAWGGAFAYTFQLYFDFSGYSDMAIGLARMFGILLPANFASPYKAKNIIDFWRSWHMTLSRFLRDYVYIPLGGSRKGSISRYINILVTMLLGGLWHGAGWTFVVWGGLHGLYLMVNHGWLSLIRNGYIGAFKSNWISGAVSRSLTLLAVIIGWVFFRAETFDAAVTMLGAMSGGNGISLPGSLESIFAGMPWLNGFGIQFGGVFVNDLAANWVSGLKWILTAMLIALYAPNTQQFMSSYRPTLEPLGSSHSERKPIGGSIISWSPSKSWALIMSASFIYTLSNMSGVSEFLYYDF